MENFSWCASFRKFCTSTLALGFSVIPSKARIHHFPHSAKAGIPHLHPSFPRKRESSAAFFVIPPKAGIQHFEVFAAPGGYLLSQV
jgi:hypothetical protein